MALQRKPQRPDRAGLACPPVVEDGQEAAGSSGRSPVVTESGPSSPDQVRSKAIALLARREHSRMELHRKLLRAGCDGEVIAPVLDALESEKLLSDQRFAESVARVRGARYGSRRVADDLRRTGVGTEATALVHRLQASDEERARELWTRKFGATPADAAARAKQMRFLLARGFPTDVIYRVVPRPARGGEDV